MKRECLRGMLALTIVFMMVCVSFALLIENSKAEGSRQDSVINVNQGVFDDDWDGSVDDAGFFANIEGYGVQGIYIEIYNSNDELIADGYTDPDGEIWFYDFPDDDYYWYAWNNSEFIEYGEFNIGTQIQNVNSLHSYNDFYVYAWDIDWYGVEGVTVDIYDENGTWYDGGETDEDGEFSSLDIPQGYYTFEYFFEGTRLANGSFYSYGEGEYGIRVDAYPFDDDGDGYEDDVWIWVYDTEYNSIEGAEVYIDGEFVGYTDEWGNLEDYDYPEGWHYVEAYYGEYNASTWFYIGYEIYVDAYSEDYDGNGWYDDVWIWVYDSDGYDVEGAEIYIDGEFVGYTDEWGNLEDYDYPEGWHFVEAYYDTGDRDVYYANTTFYSEGDGPANVSYADLWIFNQGVYQWVDIYIDGEYYDWDYVDTGWNEWYEDIELQEGWHNFTAMAEDGSNDTATVYLPANETTRVNLTIGISGLADIWIFNEGSAQYVDVYIDDEYYGWMWVENGWNEWGTELLTEGNHTFYVSAEDGSNFTAVVYVGIGEIVRVNLTIGISGLADIWIHNWGNEQYVDVYIDDKYYGWMWVENGWNEWGTELLTEGNHTFYVSADDGSWDSVVAEIIINETTRVNLSVGTANDPFIIYGIVYDNATMLPIEGAYVTAYNYRTDETLNTTTNSDGQYDIDLLNYPTGYQDGDTIEVTATFEGRSDSAIVYANSSMGGIEVNLYIPSEFISVEFTFYLKAGWNLISLPMIVSAGTYYASDIAGEIGDVCMFVVWRDVGKEYKVYVNGFSDPDEDFLVYEDYGFFVYVTEDVYWTAYGYQAGQRTVTLEQGWNLFGWTSMATIMASELGAIIGENCRFIVMRDNVTHEYYPYISGIPSTDFSIIPGNGYFIYVADDTTFSYGGENEIPEIEITYPEEGDTVSGTIYITGTASDADGTVQRVEVKIDDGTWITANGTENWTYEWDTTGVKNGNHTIYARAFDGFAYSPIAMVTVNVSNEILLPDLMVSEDDITIQPENPVEGDVVTIYVAIHNIGEVDIDESFLVGFYVDDVWQDQTTIEYLPAGSSEYISFTWDTAGMEGDHTIMIWADYNDTIEEENEDNNQANASVYVSPAELPDLIVESISFVPEDPIEGDAVMIEATITNIGDADTGGFWIQFFDHFDEDVNNIGEEYVDYLGAGESIVVNITWIATPAGEHMIEVIADAYDDVLESNETNNVLSEVIVVQEPGYKSPAYNLSQESSMLSVTVNNRLGNKHGGA